MVGAHISSCIVKKVLLEVIRLFLLIGMLCKREIKLSYRRELSREII